MSQSYTISNTTSFTGTHAKKLASKVAADLKRIQRFYGSPNDALIANYELEIIELLKGGYLSHVTYGFRKNEAWVEPALRYTARELASNESTDDDPGRIRPNANIDGAAFGSFLIYSTSWHQLTSSARDEFKKILPFPRTDGVEPKISGYLQRDLSYSAGGRALDRATVRSY